MDPQIPSSFIPKKPLDGSGRSGRHSIAGGGLLTLLALLIFISSLIAAGAAFAYQQYIQNSITSAQTSLQRAQAAFDPSVIQDLVRLDSRINNAESLLGKHVSPSALFTFLSLQTLQTVSLTGFTYQLNDDGSAGITLTGIAQDFSAVALQSDQFSASKGLKDVVFSDINVDQQGHVSFTVAATVDPSLINYGKNIGTPSNAASASSVQTAAPMQPATNTAQTSTTVTSTSSTQVTQ